MSIARNFKARESRPGHYIVKTTLTLPRDLVEWMDDMLGSGRYTTLAQLIIAALRHYKHHLERGEKHE